MASQRKRLFADGVGNHGTVTLNRFDTPQREFGWYGEAFHEAGKRLVEELRSDPQFGSDGPPPDWFKAAPVVHMYKHAMELCLKSVILAGADVLPFRGQPEVDRERLFTGHSLQRVLQDLERIFAAFGWDWDFGLPRFRSVKDFRSVVHQLDEVGDAFRYPAQTDGSSPMLKRGFRFNLFELCEVLDPVYRILDGVAYRAWEQLQSEYQMDAEAGQCELGNASV